MRAVIFDLDQTLLNRDATFEGFIRGQFRRYAGELPGGTTEDSYLAAFKRFDCNGYSKKEVMFTHACELLGVAEHAAMLTEDFINEYGTEPVLLEDTLATLETLRGNYRLGLVTNGRTLAQNCKITHSGLRPFFDDIRISQSEGIKKPDSRIFQSSLEALEVGPGEGVYVGDHPLNDVTAAMDAGLRGIWRRSPHYDAPEECDAVINCLAELPDVLAGW